MMIRCAKEDWPAYCNDAVPCLGDHDIALNYDHAAIVECESISGDLRFDDAWLTGINLPVLTSVGGATCVSGNGSHYPCN